MGAGSIKLADVLSPELICPALHSTKRDAVIQELAAFLADRHTGVDEHEAAEVLLAREEQGSTAIDDGIAVPHAKLDSVDTIIACLGRSPKGVDFGSGDDKKSHFFFAVVSPISSSGEHLKLLAQFSHVFKSAEFRDSLMAAKSAQDMYALITAQDSN